MKITRALVPLFLLQQSLQGQSTPLLRGVDTHKKTAAMHTTPIHDEATIRASIIDMGHEQPHSRQDDTNALVSRLRDMFPLSTELQKSQTPPILTKDKDTRQVLHTIGFDTHDKNESQALIEALILQKAARHNPNIESLSLLFEIAPDAIYAQNKDGNNIALLAVKNDNNKLLNLVLNLDNTLVLACNKDGYNGATLAMALRNKDTFIMSVSWQPSLMTDRDQNGMRPEDLLQKDDAYMQEAVNEIYSEIRLKPLTNLLVTMTILTTVGVVLFLLSKAREECRSEDTTAWPHQHRTPPTHIAITGESDITPSTVNNVIRLWTQAETPSKLWRYGDGGAITDDTQSGFISFATMLFRLYHESPNNTHQRNIVCQNMKKIIAQMEAAYDSSGSDFSKARTIHNYLAIAEESVGSCIDSIRIGYIRFQLLYQLHAPPQAGHSTEIENIRDQLDTVARIIDFVTDVREMGIIHSKGTHGKESRVSPGFVRLPDISAAAFPAGYQETKTITELRHAHVTQYCQDDPARYEVLSIRDDVEDILQIMNTMNDISAHKLPLKHEGCRSLADEKIDQAIRFIREERDAQVTNTTKIKDL